MTQNADSGATDKTITVEVTVTVDRDADPLKVAERLFDFLASDPDDLFPDILTVENFDAHIDSSGAA